MVSTRQMEIKDERYGFKTYEDAYEWAINEIKAQNFVTEELCAMDIKVEKLAHMCCCDDEEPEEDFCAKLFFSYLHCEEDESQ